MMEFIRNCYQWIAENYKEITMTMTSAQFISILSSLILLYKNWKKTSENVTSSKKLNEAIDGTKVLADDVAALKEENATLATENSKLRESVESLTKDVANYQDVTLKKLNCMLEVQSIVYSTIKDETIRKSVNSVLIGAKYAETDTREALKQEIENLKTKLDEETENVRSLTRNATDNLAKIVDVGSADSSGFVRY